MWADSKICWAPGYCSTGRTRKESFLSGHNYKRTKRKRKAVQRKELRIVTENRIPLCGISDTLFSWTRSIWNTGKNKGQQNQFKVCPERCNYPSSQTTTTTKFDSKDDFQKHWIYFWSWYSIHEGPLLYICQHPLIIQYEMIHRSMCEPMSEKAMYL